jgi:spore coat protein SA
MTQQARRIAIVGHPWDKMAVESDSVGVIIAYQLARRLARDWRVTLYGQRGPRQARWETDGTGVEFKRLKVLRKPHALLEVLVGILSCYTKKRIDLYTLYFYHVVYALRVALSIRLVKYDAVMVLDFPQIASVVKFLNPSATVCLHMHCEWLTQYATAGSERRLRVIDLIICCSDYISDLVRRRFPELADRCHTVYNGVDPEIFSPPPDDQTSKDRTEHLLYVGRLSPEKGIHDLIEAFKILAESRPRLQLHLVGAASMWPYLSFCANRDDPVIAALEVFYGDRLSEMVRRQLTHRNKSYSATLVALAAGDERIRFCGAFRHAEMPGFYRNATMLVFPSVANETFGVPVIEAMACGLPVVSTYSGGIPEIVEQGRTGVLVPRGDAGELARAISRLLGDPSLARNMGDAGRERVLGRFTWDSSARRIASLIDSTSSNARLLDAIAPGTKRALKEGISS